MSGEIFISYRRQESGWSARSLHDRLCREFDPGQIFMDLDAIALGEDFVDAIEATVARCDVLVAVIGNNWLTSKDERGGRRLDNPEDFVRMEIGTALKRKVRVIPVLVDGALMPRADDLPQDLKPIVRRNALAVTTISFEGDLQRLAGAIRQVLEKVAADQREKERLEAELRKKERLEAELREKERGEAGQGEKERLEAEQREKERLEAERLEKERLEARQREKARLEGQRVASEIRDRQKNERLETGEKKPESRNLKLLRLMDGYSWVPFALSIFSLLFIPNSDEAMYGRTLLGAMANQGNQAGGVAFFLVLQTGSVFPLISSFFRYAYRRSLEATVSVIQVVFWIILLIFAEGTRLRDAVGIILSGSLLLIGASIKVWLLIRRRELEET
jgi:hypothetical protein